MFAIGDYTVAFTCRGNIDSDNKNEELDFLSPINGNPVTVTAGTPVENVDF